MSETCESCRHSYPIDPQGRWRPSFGVVWHTTHVHCRRHSAGKAHVISKGSACSFSPSQYEAEGTSFPELQTWHP